MEKSFFIQDNNWSLAEGDWTLLEDYQTLRTSSQFGGRIIDMVFTFTTTIHCCCFGTVRIYFSAKKYYIFLSLTDYIDMHNILKSLYLNTSNANRAG